jgi:hypothetical protein
MPPRGRRETATYRGSSGAYYGFTVFSLDSTLPRAAGVYAMARRVVGPGTWEILLIGETANFVDALSDGNTDALGEARRRGATHVLLYVSPIATARRREAAHDLWRNIRSPLVSWDHEEILRHA